jgi:hypothetical protein
VVMFPMEWSLECTRCGTRHPTVFATLKLRGSAPKPTPKRVGPYDEDWYF